ncbi:hypothetical protein [Teichococcus oryzae]|uniref:Uncharacterized protein n=1 Tax=Teichococcus oryzae TaxID=1608942 RepID=A0A5B2T9D2_9PROT|nr:hypothetical protein [Pseudoroseomonas oryzae]KAA2211267.1 hypothetical protein F0Q34_20990 [Pseudoroseomonas oryzae]
MTAASAWRHLMPVAGILLGPGIWAVNMELGQILAYPECSGGFRFSTLATFLGAALALLGAFLSYRASGFRGGKGGPSAFVGSVCALLGSIFAFALLLQGGATLVLTGCER